MDTSNKKYIKIDYQTVENILSSSINDIYDEETQYSSELCFSRPVRKSYQNRVFYNSELNIQAISQDCSHPFPFTPLSLVMTDLFCHENNIPSASLSLLSLVCAEGSECIDKIEWGKCLFKKFKLSTDGLYKICLKRNETAVFTSEFKNKTPFVKIAAVSIEIYRIMCQSLRICNRNALASVSIGIAKLISDAMENQ
ncbi:hypothetical protein KKF34_12475 [Myxococcota bacterium]|nr:hypothetical protein [Myxococcota bacterium]MBU1381485.1 hypothetical protein [Myxococcota bacterium]MBU1497681.1 hypothetical protein [Myxococcota bacterium]